MTHGHTENQGPEAGYETKDVNVRAMILVGAIVIVVVIVSIIVLNEYFVSVKEQLVYDTVLRPESVTLRDLRATEDEVLNSYKLVDSTAGTYRIPIDRAMELMAEEAFLKSQ